jgi:hypothetical protein
MVSLDTEIKFERVAIYGKATVKGEVYWFNIATKKDEQKRIIPRKSKTNIVAKMVNGKKEVIDGDLRIELLAEIISALKETI